MGQNISTQNGALVNGNLDCNLRSPGGLILAHTHFCGGPSAAANVPCCSATPAPAPAMLRGAARNATNVDAMVKSRWENRVQHSHTNRGNKIIHGQLGEHQQVEEKGSLPILRRASFKQKQKAGGPGDPSRNGEGSCGLPFPNLQTAFGPKESFQQWHGANSKVKSPGQISWEMEFLTSPFLAFRADLGSGFGSLCRQKNKNTLEHDAKGARSLVLPRSPMGGVKRPRWLVSSRCSRPRSPRVWPAEPAPVHV